MQQAKKRGAVLLARPVSIDYDPDLPIFASSSFLQAVGDEYGWLGGFDQAGNLCCVLPYTIIHKTILRMVRFRVETIPLAEEFDIESEKSFLNSAVQYFHSIGADVIIPPSNNTVFRTFPDGADAAPYGSYIIDLERSEQELWQSMQRILRQNIASARQNGVIIKDGFECRQKAYALVRETFSRSRIPFMTFRSFDKFVDGLGSNAKILYADYQGKPQSIVVFAYSTFCAYAIYAGNISHQQQGANKLLYWEAMLMFKHLGSKRFDFYGARINPPKGSKQAELAAFKRRFGAELKIGYVWKYPLKHYKYHIYNLLCLIRNKGDIVDFERHKLNAHIHAHT
jgi:hypothetical protein